MLKENRPPSENPPPAAELDREALVGISGRQVDGGNLDEGEQREAPAREKLCRERGEGPDPEEGENGDVDDADRGRHLNAPEHPLNEFSVPSVERLISDLRFPARKQDGRAELGPTEKPAFDGSPPQDEKTECRWCFDGFNKPPSFTIRGSVPPCWLGVGNSGCGKSR